MFFDIYHKDIFILPLGNGMVTQRENNPDVIRNNRLFCIYSNYFVMEIKSLLLLLCPILSNAKVSVARFSC